MKKLLALLLVLSMALSFAACGGTTNNNAGQKEPAPSTDTTTPNTSDTTTTPDTGADTTTEPEVVVDNTLVCSFHDRGTRYGGT